MSGEESPMLDMTAEPFTHDRGPVNEMGGAGFRQVVTVYKSGMDHMQTTLFAHLRIPPEEHYTAPHALRAVAVTVRGPILWPMIWTLWERGLEGARGVVHVTGSLKTFTSGVFSIECIPASEAPGWLCADEILPLYDPASEVLLYVELASQEYITTGALFLLQIDQAVMYQKSDVLISHVPHMTNVYKTYICVTCRDPMPLDSRSQCAGCWSMPYCSTKCQKIDWKKRHRRECAGWKAVRSAVEDLARIAKPYLQCTQ